MNKDFWNERYGQHDTVYGEEPNEFFKQQIDLLKAGKIFLPAEGEGRNALYAASKGWQVSACDYSSVAQEKTLQKAMQRGYHNLEYHVLDLNDLSLAANTLDAVALIYSHIPSVLKTKLHPMYANALKPGGRIIVECFTPQQLQYQSGGPKDPDFLYTLADLKQDFAGFKILVGEESALDLKEGPFHSGTAHVVRFVAQK